jgi:hypothetical protein
LKKLEITIGYGIQRRFLSWDGIFFYFFVRKTDRLSQVSRKIWENKVNHA